MSHPALVLFAVIGLGVLYVLVPVLTPVARRFYGFRKVRCPETGQGARIGLDAGYALLTAALGRPKLKVGSCSRWPGRRYCAQSCIRRLQGPLSRT